MSGIEAEPSVFGIGDFASASIERDGKILIPAGLNIDLSGIEAVFGEGKLPIGGHFIVECWSPEGTLRWQDIAENGVTDAGITSLLNIMFRSGTQITTWYLGLIDNAGFVALASGDTSASHSGWSEVATGNISNSVRPTWSPGAPSSGAIVNGTTVDFNMINTSSLTVKALFLISDSTKGGTSGTLFSTAAFTGGTQATNNGDTLKVTYTVAASSS